MECRIERYHGNRQGSSWMLYYGAQTQRSIENFEIAQDINRMPKEIIYAFAYLKKELRRPIRMQVCCRRKKCDLIVRLRMRYWRTCLDEAFPLVVWQTGSGTQTNMNVNEVIANRAHVLNGGKLTDEVKVLMANDDGINRSSSNDTFPSAMHIAAYKDASGEHDSVSGVVAPYPRHESREFMPIVKIGRTHFMDATPLTLGQEFSGYAAQLEYGIQSIKNTLPHLAELALGGTAVGTGINTRKTTGRRWQRKYRN